MLGMLGADHENDLLHTGSERVKALGECVQDFLGRVRLVISKLDSTQPGEYRDRAVANRLAP